MLRTSNNLFQICFPLEEVPWTWTTSVKGRTAPGRTRPWTNCSHLWSAQWWAQPGLGFWIGTWELRRTLNGSWYCFHQCDGGTSPTKVLFRTSLGRGCSKTLLVWTSMIGLSVLWPKCSSPKNNSRSAWIQSFTNLIVFHVWMALRISAFI